SILGRNARPGQSTPQRDTGDPPENRRYQPVDCDLDNRGYRDNSRGPADTDLLALVGSTKDNLALARQHLRMLPFLFAWRWYRWLTYKPHGVPNSKSTLSGRPRRGPLFAPSATAAWPKPTGSCYPTHRCRLARPGSSGPPTGRPCATCRSNPARRMT